MQRSSKSKTGSQSRRDVSFLLSEGETLAHFVAMPSIGLQLEKLLLLVRLPYLGTIQTHLPLKPERYGHNVEAGATAQDSLRYPLRY